MEESYREKQRLGHGLGLAFTGLILSFVPILGALLALMGLFRIISACVPENKGRYCVYIILGIICAAAAVGALACMAWVFFARPDIISGITATVYEWLGLSVG